MVENRQNDMFKELLTKQQKNVAIDKRLQYTDLKRICKYVLTSLFDEDRCALWSGYVTNANKANKGTYINFYFNKKKVALHRLLYINFVGPLEDNEYLKFTCPNHGTCCNVKHLKKFVYKNNNTNNEIPKSESPEKNQTTTTNKPINFKISFD